MLISIGILAWNEEANIAVTLESLFRQDALLGCAESTRGCRWEVIVVPNGCSDQTAAVSRRVLQQLTAGSAVQISARVEELAEAGKSNAWNRYVHELSDPAAELIVMLDADIEFVQAQTLSNTIQVLLSEPGALAAVDLPLKDAWKKRRRTLVERLSIAGSQQAMAGPAALSGQFFSARARILRQIWMPKGMSVEDGYLNAMIRTECMLSKEDAGRILRAPGASHYYETLTHLKSIFRHELRLVMGTALNCYLLWDFLLFATDPTGPGAGVLLRNLLDKDPHWYERFVANAVQVRGWWVLPRGMLFRRFAGLSKRSRGWVPGMALACVGFMLDLPIFLVANRRLKKGRSIGFW
ncbi:MAG: glycosyltransferase [Sinobacteraceae bacterium]|nr:glycosyltransferase [Nevskiaceae bacterium]